MILTVLGKYGPYPPVGGGTSSYKIEGKSTAVALDFGSGALGRFGDRLPDAVVLSHLHYDHISDTFPLVYKLKDRLKVYMPFTECAARDLIFSEEKFEPIRITDGMKARINEFELTFTAMTHSVESYAVTVSDGESVLFYSGDTVCNAKIPELVKNCDFALLDAAQSKDAPSEVPHMKLWQAEDLAAHTRARVVVTHIPPVGFSADEAKERGLEIADEFRSYSIRRTPNE